MKKAMSVCCLALCCVCGRVEAETYMFSMLPRYFPEKLTAMTTPLVQHLSKELQQPVTLLLADNFAGYENQIMKGAISIGYENPLVYVNIAEKHEVLATGMQGKGGDKFRGLVIASPQWYPGHPEDVRRGLLRFLENVLGDDRFDYQNFNRYLR